MSFGNEPISTLTRQNNPSDLLHHDFVQDTSCTPALMASRVASESIDSFLNPRTLVGLKALGNPEQGIYTMSAEHSELGGSSSDLLGLAIPETAGSHDMFGNNIPRNPIYQPSAQPFDTSPLQVPSKPNIPYSCASPGYFDKSPDISFPTAVWEYNGFERDPDHNIIRAPYLKLSVSQPGSGASRHVVWDLAITKEQLIIDGDSIRQDGDAPKIVTSSGKVKSTQCTAKRNQVKRAPRQKPRSRRPEGNACIRCLLSTHGKCVREHANQRCTSCERIYSKNIKSNPQQTLSLAHVVFFELVCYFYDEDEFPHPFSDQHEPLVISRDFSGLTSDPQSASWVLPRALALDRAHLLRYIDRLIKRSVENRLLWAIVVSCVSTQSESFVLIFEKKGIITPALRCATGLAVLFNMEKFIIYDAANINLLESQDLVAATILSVAYEIRDQLATLHNELMASCLESKDPVAIYCALQLLWSSVDSYKCLRSSEIPGLDSFLEDFRTLTPKALDIISGVKDVYGIYCCPMEGQNTQPHRDLIAAQKQFKPHLTMTYEKGDTLPLSATYCSFSTGRSYQEVMDCKMPWDRTSTETTINPPESKNPYFLHPTNNLPSTTGNGIFHDQYPTSLDPDFLPSLTTGDSGPDDLLGASATEFAFWAGQDHRLNQVSFFHDYPYLENNYHYLDENEKQNYPFVGQSPWNWNETSGDFFDDGQGFV